MLYKIHRNIKILPFLAGFFFILFTAGQVGAINVGDSVNFNVDQNFDLSARSQVPATLVKVTSNLYFYVETGWWNTQPLAKKTEILSGFDSLSIEFSDNIYPTLTSVFGSEWSPGVDGDNKITLLFHSLKENTSGYFRSADEYVKLQAPDSNEREMVYLSIAKISDSQLKGFLAHEFAHLITFNQKNRIQGVQEEVWLNEARADYTSTILGYDKVLQGSNLQKRINDFLVQPADSLTEWQNTKYDYSTESMFVHYLMDHYGINILIDSLKSKLVGIPSINAALLKNGAEEDFSQIFTNWTIAVIVNDCLQDAKYCYLGQNLQNLRINPTLNFLPLTGSSSLSVTNITKNWSGNWQKIIGGNGNLTLDFSSLAGLNFKVPYILVDKNNNYTVKFITLDDKEKGQITINDFGTKYNSLIIIPTLQTKLSEFNGFELTYPYAFTASISQNMPEEDPVIIQKLLNQIADLKKQIADILAHSPSPAPGSGGCGAFNNNLYLGISNSNDVTCLQRFLKAQGTDIYPEALVTGIFGNLTKVAVVRFQQKYNIPQTGFVGVLTRTKINQLLAP